MLKFCSFVLLLAATGIYDAGAIEAPPLFVEVASGGDATPAEAYLGLWSVEVNAGQLRTPVAAITLNLPDQTHVEIQRLHWEARRGYVTQLDDDALLKPSLILRQARTIFPGSGTARARGGPFL